MQKYHKNSIIARKKKRGKNLTKEDKKFNRILAKKRVKIEHIFAKIKSFKIFSTKYRNCRRRFGLRMNLICGIINVCNGF